MENFLIKYSPKEWANLTKEKIKEKVSKMTIKPSVTILNALETPASLSYVKGKIKDCEEVGIEAKYVGQDKITSVEELRAEVIHSSTTGIIVQEPLPNFFRKKAYSGLIYPLADVDGTKRNSIFTPATPLGIMNWLNGNEISLVGMDVCIIGRSDLVGKPLANLMTAADATVTLCHSKTKSLKEKIQMADIVVAAIGNPNVLKREWFEDGKTRLVIDVGINRVNGKLTGDVPKFESLNGGYCTPVPGGVGLLTRVALLENILKAHQMQGKG